MADWDKITSRGNVEDRRRAGPIVGGITVTGVVLILAFNYLSGGNLSTTLQDLTRYAGGANGYTNNQPVDDSYKQFAEAVLGSDNDVWKQKFKEKGLVYQEPKLVLFRGYTDSACGGADSQVGPHYCPEDQTIYLDETFFDVLTSELDARGGDVAQGYVISHEVGHHVQNLLGTLHKMESAPDNQTSIHMELQADCFGGIWANSLTQEHVIQKDEIAEAMDAAQAVGDDRIQKKTQGQITPETWTHGSAEQRLSWFMKGYDNGSIDVCNTFK